MGQLTNLTEKSPAEIIELLELCIQKGDNEWIRFLAFVIKNYVSIS